MRSSCYSDSVQADQAKDYYTWNAQSKSLAVRFDVNVIDRINIEVMRGFAVTRRRGTEPGGILVGSIQLEPQPVVTVDDFEAIPCEYSHGPSYILSENDQRNFGEAIQRWRDSGDTGLKPVAFWRAHTRDGLGLDETDAALFKQYFSDPSNFVLVIKPFATRANLARICLQDGAGLQTSGTPPEFLFARAGSFTQETAPPIAPVAPPPPARERIAPAPEPVPYRASMSAQPEAPALEVSQEIAAPEPEPPAPQPPPIVIPRPARAAPEERSLFAEIQPVPVSRWKQRVAWVAFTLATLGLGALIGFEYAGGQVPLAAGAQAPGKAGSLDPFDFQLTAKGESGGVLLTWNRASAPILKAQRGLLSITESSVTKSIPIAANELQSGSIIYHHLTGSVLFRLELFFRDNRSLIEILNWSGPPPAPNSSQSR